MRAKYKKKRAAKAGDMKHKKDVLSKLDAFSASLKAASKAGPAAGGEREAYKGQVLDHRNAEKMQIGGKLGDWAAGKLEGVRHIDHDARAGK
jgi:hypothetical protein